MIKDIEISWEITSGCNLRCKHCIVSADEHTNNDVDFDDIINFIKKLKDHNLSINFTGGEPFFRKDFLDIVRYCVDNNIKVQIITNGLLFTEESFELLKENNISLGISVESFKKEHFESIRGKNTYDKLISNINILKEKNISFNIYTTFNKYNEDEIKEMLSNAKKYGAKIHFNDITVDGRAKDNTGILVNSKSLLDDLMQYSDEVFELDTFNYAENCWATNAILFISSAGNIFLCTEENRCNKGTRLGNVKTFPIDEYYKNAQLLDYDEDELKCPYKVYFNEMITYNSNVDEHCCMLPAQKDLKTFDELYKAFDELLTDAKEAHKDLAIEYSEGNALETLVSHMYPFGLQVHNGIVLWVLYDSSEFVQELIKNDKLKFFIMKVNNIIININSALCNELISVFKEKNNSSSLPHSNESYIIIKELTEKE